MAMAPVVIAVLLATTWVPASSSGEPSRARGLWLATGASGLIVRRIRDHLLWLLGAGALLGALGRV